MNREVHVRFWEGVEVQLLCATRLPARLRLGHRGAPVPGPLLRVLQLAFILPHLAMSLIVQTSRSDRLVPPDRGVAHEREQRAL
jgi:hypothetical protein